MNSLFSFLASFLHKQKQYQNNNKNGLHIANANAVPYSWYEICNCKNNANENNNFYVTWHANCYCNRSAIMLLNTR